MTSKRGFKEYRAEHNGVTWKDYVDLRFAEMDKALIVAHTELSRRLEGMNEIRSQLDRQAATFLTRDSAEANEEKLLLRVAALETALSAEAARNKVYVVLVSAIISTFVATLMGLVLYYLTRGT